jgi:F-type H+-transporting ATPase subunit epsilon
MALTCIVVTPEETAVNQTADFVAIPLYDGEIGIAPKHSPVIGRLGFGELRIRSGSTVSRYYIDGGFVHVVNDVVSILTSRAIPAAKLDEDAATSQLSEATANRASTDEQLQARDRSISQARGQLAVARRAHRS